MAPILQTLSPAAAVVAGSLVASVWQSLLLAACAWICLRSLPKLSAATRSVVWIAVLLLAVTLPLLSIAAAKAHEPTGHAGLFHLGQDWGLSLVVLWALLASCRLTQLAIGAVRLHNLARRATPVQPYQALAALLQSRGRKAELCTSSEVDRPSVVGFFHSRILIAPDLLAELSYQELEQVVLHELEHLRRRDDWTNLLQKIALALFPLNPVLLWLDYRLCLEREQACDDGVLHATKAHKAYAACLTNLAERSLMRRSVLLALSIAGRRKESELARRIYRILCRPQAGMGRTQTRFALGALMAGMLACTGVLSHAPQLVSFGSGTRTVADVVPAFTQTPVGVTGQASYVAAMAKAPAPRAILARATILAPRRAAAVKAVAAKAIHKQPTLLKTSFEREEYGQSRPQPRVALAGWQAETAPPARLVFAVEEDSPFTYAAVPVRGGWLIVQL